MKLSERRPTMRNGRVSGLVALTVTLILGIFPITLIAQASSRERVSKEREVFKAVLLYAAKQSRGGKAKDVLYFVSIDDGDPSDSFLDELQKSGLNARKQSELRIEDALDGVPRDANTHMRAITLSVGNLRWRNEVEVDVSGGYWRGGRRSDGGDYETSLYLGQWKVTKFRRIILNSIL
jgi:hypothetical protein